MAIVSFWSTGEEETGKSSAILAIATLLSIKHNYKVLVLNTKYNDKMYEDCYWKEDKLIGVIRNSQITLDVGQGISGLAKAIKSNKTSPEIVTNYTKIVFKDRLELLVDTNSGPREYDEYKQTFKEIVKIANKYYDLVFVDIDKKLDEITTSSLLEISDLIIMALPQNLRKINEYKELKVKHPILRKKEVLPLLGRYDKNSKYNVKNVTRYLKERNEICAIPYNTLFLEACNEAKVADYFIKYRRANSKDDNSEFVEEVGFTIDKIIERLKNLQMKM